MASSTTQPLAARRESCTPSRTRPLRGAASSFPVASNIGHGKGSGNSCPRSAILSTRGFGTVRAKLHFIRAVQQGSPRWSAPNPSVKRTAPGGTGVCRLPQTLGRTRTIRSCSFVHSAYQQSTSHCGAHQPWSHTALISIKFALVLRWPIVPRHCAPYSSTHTTQSFVHFLSLGSSNFHRWLVLSYC